MSVQTLAEALEREHREIDAGLEAFMRNPALGEEPLVRALDALRRHIYLEEEFLFPPLRRSNLIASIMVMIREHAEIWGTIEHIEAHCLGFLEGKRLERATLWPAHLLEQLEHHNSKEEPVIYACLEERLDRDVAEKVQALLVSGELPSGWTCQGMRT